MINRGHVLMQIYHKNVEVHAKKVVVGVDTYCRYCPISLIFGRFLYILMKDVVWAYGNLNDVLGMRGSHSMFHYRRIR